MSKKKIVIPLLIIGLVVGGLFWWQFSASKNTLTESDKAKAYQQILGRDVKTERKIETNNYQGKFFSLKFPSNFSIKQATTSAEQKTETLRLISTEPRLNLTVMAVDGSNTSLKDYSAVKFRTENKEYKQSDQEMMGEKGLFFDKVSSESEKTVFVKKGSMIFSLSVTGSNRDEAEKVYQQVIQTLSILEIK